MQGLGKYRRRRKIKQKDLKKLRDKERRYNKKPGRRYGELTEKLKEEPGKIESQNTKDIDREVLRMKIIQEEGMNDSTRLEILEDRMAGSPGGEKKKCPIEWLQQEEHKARNKTM